MTMRSIVLALAALIWLAPGAKAQFESATLFAVLNGGNVCKKDLVLLCGLGDPDGVGSVTVTIVSETRLCVGLVVDNIATPTVARIHAGSEALNGPAVATLPLPASGNPGTASGCVTLDTETLVTMRATPQNFYISIRNSDSFSGIRGQLF